MSTLTQFGPPDPDAVSPHLSNLPLDCWIAESLARPVETSSLHTPHAPLTVCDAHLRHYCHRETSADGAGRSGGATASDWAVLTQPLPPTPPPRARPVRRRAARRPDPAWPARSGGLSPIIAASDGWPTLRQCDGRPPRRHGQTRGTARQSGTRHGQTARHTARPDTSTGRHTTRPDTRVGQIRSKTRQQANCTARHTAQPDSRHRQTHDTARHAATERCTARPDTRDSQNHGRHGHTVPCIWHGMARHAVRSDTNPIVSERILGVSENRVHCLL